MLNRQTVLRLVACLHRRVGACGGRTQATPGICERGLGLPAETVPTAHSKCSLAYMVTDQADQLSYTLAAKPGTPLEQQQLDSSTGVLLSVGIYGMLLYQMLDSNISASAAAAFACARHLHC